MTPTDYTLMSEVYEWQRTQETQSVTVGLITR